MPPRRELVARVDENRCIGCRRCIDVCPVDAIVGANGLMHTVVETWCIGCDLCPPACPVDCIDMRPPRGEWNAALKRAAGERGRKRKARLAAKKLGASTREKRRQVLAEILSRRR